MPKKSLPARIFGQLKTICIHKYWVFYYACKLGIPFQGFLHDFSKFSPEEFIESVIYYTGDTSSINNAKAIKGYSQTWFHHKGRNKHHYEYWMDKFDLGGFNMMMPFKYAVEEIADYLAAGKTYMKKKFTFQSEYEWWLNRLKNPLAMHPALQEYNTIVLKTMAEQNRILTKSELRNIYDTSIQHHKQEVNTWTLSTSTIH